MIDCNQLVAISQWVAQSGDVVYLNLLQTQFIRKYRGNIPNFR